MAVFWGFIGDFLGISWALSDNFLAIFWRVCGGFVAIFWRVSGNFLQYLWNKVTLPWESDPGPTPTRGDLATIMRMIHHGDQDGLE